MDSISYIYLGTTAEYIKLIPVIRKLRQQKIKVLLVLSGQTDLEAKLAEFSKLTGKISPYYAFSPKSKRASSIRFGIWAIRTLWKSIKWGRIEFNKNKGKNIVMIVQGDTVSALIGAFVAFVYRVKVFHVEAGLRTHNLLEPFPEEICRILISFFTSVHFCPNTSACKNLLRYPGVKINTFFNTSIESLSLALSVMKQKYKLPIKGKYFILIVHRQEHLYIRKDDTSKILDTIFKHATKNIPCLFVVHDITVDYLKNIGISNKIAAQKSVFPIPRLPYLQFVHLLNNCEFLITDGGGNHTESHFLGKPCLMLRKHGEQTEGVGKNVIVTEEPRLIVNFMKNYKKYTKPILRVKKWPSEIILRNI